MSDLCVFYRMFLSYIYIFNLSCLILIVCKVFEFLVKNSHQRPCKNLFFVTVQEFCGLFGDFVKVQKGYNELILKFIKSDKLPDSNMRILVKV